MTLAKGGHVGIFQPEPMCLGGIANSLAVAEIARANGAWIAPHQSGGPVATAVCLQLAACVPNFLIQEHFDPFNSPWTRELVTWVPEIDPSNGRLSLPSSPGLGLDLNLEVARAHPYDPEAYLDANKEGWEKRFGVKAEPHEPL
jgi:galactonate dehydratase